MIAEQEAVKEHSIATFACLISGVDVFLGQRLDHEKFLRVVKGVHGFHVYASEFWTEYLLHLAASGELDSPSPLLAVACELAEKLENTSNLTIDQEATAESNPLDERLAFLRHNPLLLKHVKGSLVARSLKRLESQIIQEVQVDLAVKHEYSHNRNYVPQRQRSKFNGSTDIGGKDTVSILLSSYQQTVRMLLGKDHYPGISADDFELFKSQFRSAAFTCRLSFCPRATTGFVSEELCRQHEIAHTRIAMCTVPECKYPPFVSMNALKNHIRKNHTAKPPRRSIRKVGNIPERKIPKNIDVEMPDKISSVNEGETHELEKLPLEQPLGKLALDQNSTHLTDVLDKIESTPKFPLEADNDTHMEEAYLAQDSTSEFVGDSDDADPSVEVAIDSMGYRGCSIPGCGVRLRGVSVDVCDTEISHHYWNWHHADSMARCSVSRCQQVFESKKILQSHYEYRHTTLFCNHCDANYPEGFDLEEELRYHWQTQHLKRVRRWVVCRVEQLPSGRHTCNDCDNETEYDRWIDAIRHLRQTHFENHMGDGLPTSQLEQFVREAWIYQIDDHKPTQDQLPEYDSTDDSDVIELDDMFYVEELA